MHFRNLALGALSAALGAFTLQAQCYEPNTGSLLLTGDDIVSTVQSLGFAFPFNGTTYTDCYVTTNGLLYLSNGALPVTPGSGCCAGSTATLVAGDPMIAAYWTDLNVVAGVGQLLFNNTLPGKCVITWQDTYEYGTTNARTIQLTLWVTGEVDVLYDGRCTNATHTVLVGMSEAAGAAVPAAIDITAGGVSTTTTNYELFDPTTNLVDVAGNFVQFFATLPGYAWVNTSCPSGSNTNYGTGCYDIVGSDSIYNIVSPPATAATVLSGAAYTFTPAGQTYLLTSGGTYVAPTAAVDLVLIDDSAVTTPALTTPFPYPGGVATSFSVCSNGHVAVAAGNSVAYAPVAATMLNNPQTAWYSWHDYNPAAAGSGKVKFEQIGTVTYITWDGVYNYSGTTAAAANTWQMQFDSNTGSVVIAYQTVSAAAHTLPLGEPHLIGYSPGGASNDDGVVDFTTALPMMVPLTGTVHAMTLNADVRPVSTASTGTVVNYTLANVPELIPSSGIYVGLQIFSFSSVPAPGLDMAFLGMPGCWLLVGGLDVMLSQVTLSPTQVTPLSVPPGVSPGFQLFAQGVGMITPGSLPGGLNAFGAETSNAVASVIGQW
ncbi:MAG: hypothetical protein K8J09_06055 [Planctomycetes bacterium]|nr:hypothetical protein [Planctomycetota bacterium]MCC7399391.1 hypothetical protein [Planctomycetota bacterium]